MRGKEVVPSVATLGGLLLAFWSLTMTASGRYEAAAWLIFAAACADIADGALARGLHTISPFGKQLDSLVDLVAAGVAPGFLVYTVYFESWGTWGVLLGFTWVAFVAVRLARFNTASLVDGAFFVGVPCPIAGTVLAQYVVFSQATWGHDGEAAVAAACLVLLGALMLSDVPYWKSSTLMPHSFFRYPYGSGVIAMLVLAIWFPRQILFVGTAVSIVGAAVLRVVRVVGTATAPAR